MTTPVYHRLHTSLEQTYSTLDREKVIVWLMTFHKGLKIEDCEGRTISYEGVEFEGAPREVFWSFIRPCLDKVVDETLARAEDLGDRYAPEVTRQGIDEARDLLKSFVTRVYRRMVDVDRRLRGKGDPGRVEPDDAQPLIEDAHRRIDEQTDAMLRQVRVPSRFDRMSGWMNRHHVVSNMVSGLLGGAFVLIMQWLLQ